jgi:hypothetical protein
MDSGLQNGMQKTVMLYLDSMCSAWLQCVFFVLHDKGHGYHVEMRKESR